MPVNFDKRFTRDLNNFSVRLKGLVDATQERVSKAIELIVARWHAECVKRVPVDEGFLRNRILTNTKADKDGIVGEVGSNLDYAVFLEFGTKHIARGLVKALGERVDITDAEAIKNWPAKDQLKIGDGAGSMERMPWLRTSWMAIEDWAIQTLKDAFSGAVHES